MKNTEILKKYVCVNPFKWLDIQGGGDYLCCPSWCSVNISKDKRLDWFSEEATNVRKSVLDGSYKYCNHLICPSLNNIINNNNKSDELMEKSEFKKKYGFDSPEEIEKFKTKPESVLFGWDRSCNLKCPSCRPKVIKNDPEGSDEFKEKDKIMNMFETDFSESVKQISVTGSGDPFYSNIYRKFLVNFDNTKYPNLEKVYVITNGNLLNKKMWESLKSSPYIKMIEISIDAGTKNTYENVTRLNGKWDKLIENLKFLSTIDSLHDVILSMVVSKHNYKEMFIFYETMMGIFENSKFNITINFRQHVYWESGKYSSDECEKIQVYNDNHPLFDDFKSEALKIHNKPSVNHNFNHLFKVYETDNNQHLI